MLYPGVGPGERNKRLNFGKNPDHIMDTKENPELSEVPFFMLEVKMTIQTPTLTLEII